MNDGRRWDQTKLGATRSSKLIISTLNFRLRLLCNERKGFGRDAMIKRIFIHAKCRSLSRSFINFMNDWERMAEKADDEQRCINSKPLIKVLFITFSCGNNKWEELSTRRFEKCLSNSFFPAFCFVLCCAAIKNSRKFPIARQTPKRTLNLFLPLTIIQRRGFVCRNIKVYLAAEKCFSLSLVVWRLIEKRGNGKRGIRLAKENRKMFIFHRKFIERQSQEWCYYFVFILWLLTISVASLNGEVSSWSP